MNPRDFLEIARNLSKVDKPANCRTVFNRSYYAAYNVGVSFLKEIGIKVTTGPGGHGKVRAYFQNCGISDLEQAYYKLTSLHSNRIDADYRLEKNSVEKVNNARKALKNAESIINTTDSHSSESERSKVLSGINEYKRKIGSA